MWSELQRIVRPGAAVVMTASQPFTTTLIGSNHSAFRYALVWQKNRPTGFLNAGQQPLRNHEDILVFGGATYNPQGLRPCNRRYVRRHDGSVYGSAAASVHQKQQNYPRSVLTFPVDTAGEVGNRRLHPTQKPVALMEYLVRTYSHAGQTVLDFTMGSGTTGVACANAGRRFTGIEIDPQFFNLSVSRLRSALSEAEAIAA